MPSPRALLAVLIVGGICLAAACGWLGYHLADSFLGSDAHHGSRRSAFEEVKRLRQGLKAQQASARSATAASATHAVGGIASAPGGERAACGPAAPASPGGALPYMLHQMTQGKSAEEVTQMLERARIQLEQSSEKKDEL